MATAKSDSGIKIIADNRQAGHNYFLLDRWEAGVVLSGTEVKAARGGKVQLKDAFAEVRDNEAWVVNAHIAEYSHGNIANHVPMRKRKLLLHRRHLDKIEHALKAGGRALIPLRMYFKEALVKVEVALCTGKKLFDRRDDLKARVEMREVAQAMKQRRR